MPITRQASKKLRHDRIRTRQNIKVRETMSTMVKKARKAPTSASVNRAFGAIDKAVKNRSIHKNKASRLKSRLAKRLKK